jgi:heat shock transcription factor, other eukaryote
VPCIPTAILTTSPPPSSGGEPAVSSSPPRGLAATGPAAGVSGAVAELEEENAQLRRENARLTRDLACARHLCDGVRRLVARYEHGGEGEEDAEGEGGHGGRGGGAGPGAKPMLFGIAIGSKRHRGDDGDEEDYGEDGAEDDGEDEDVEEDDADERHAARAWESKKRRNDLSDLDVLAPSVRAAARPGAAPAPGSGDRNNSVS